MSRECSLILFPFFTQRACTTEARWTVLLDRMPVFTARKMIFTTDWSVTRIPVKKVQSRNYPRNHINQRRLIIRAAIRKLLPTGSNATKSRARPHTYLLINLSLCITPFVYLLSLEHVTNFRSTWFNSRLENVSALSQKRLRACGAANNITKYPFCR